MNAIACSINLSQGQNQKPDDTSSTDSSPPFYPYQPNEATPNRPASPEPDPQPGWQWIPVPWLYYWMATQNPINNHCNQLRRSTNPDTTNRSPKTVCVHCEAGPDCRGDAIVELAYCFASLVLSSGNEGRITYRLGEFTTGFERLVEYVKRERDGGDTSWINDVVTWRRDMSLSAPLMPSDNDILTICLGNQRIRVDCFEGSRKVGNGRHRICAAYRFGVPALPVYVSM